MQNITLVDFSQKRWLTPGIKLVLEQWRTLTCVLLTLTSTVCINQNKLDNTIPSQKLLILLSYLKQDYHYCADYWRDCRKTVKKEQSNMISYTSSVLLLDSKKKCYKVWSKNVWKKIVKTKRVIRGKHDKVLPSHAWAHFNYF